MGQTYSVETHKHVRAWAADGSIILGVYRIDFDNDAVTTGDVTEGMASVHRFARDERGNWRAHVGHVAAVREIVRMWCRCGPRDTTPAPAFRCVLCRDTQLVPTGDGKYDVAGVYYPNRKPCPECGPML